MSKNMISDHITAGYYWDKKTEERLKDTRYLEAYGYKVYSQNDEDGIIHEIFRRIGCTDKRFIEFGVQDGLESNTHCLLHYGWGGMWIEGSEVFYHQIRKKFHSVIRSGQLKSLNEYVNRNNINRLFKENGFTGEIDLLSIDIDGNDYHIWKAITCLSPRVVIIEYNAKFPPDVEWVMPYNESYVWDGTDRHGASLKALEQLGRQLGYSLIGTNITGVNAFFVRTDLTGQKFISSGTAEMLYNPMRFRSVQFVSGHPAEVCLRYSGEGINGEFEISDRTFLCKSGFYEPEYDVDGNFHLQWMKEKKAEIFVQSKESKVKIIMITFDNEMEGLQLSIGMENGIRQNFDNIPKGEQTVFLHSECKHLSSNILKIDIEINKLWSPKQVYGSVDTRVLGIAIKNVEIGI